MTGLTLLLTVLFALFKIVVSCPPNSAVKWLTSKFELHSKLDEDAVIMKDGTILKGSDKVRVMELFNNAIFFEKYYIFPGSEQRFLHPENGVLPIVISTKKGKTDVTLFVYSYSDRVDVVKQYKKKTIAYSLLSDKLQDSSVSEAVAIA